MSTVSFDDSTLDRMVLAVELVKGRLSRAGAALKSARIQYAVAGGHAVAAWVATIDPAGVRNTPDIDLIVQRPDFDQVKQSLVEIGFEHRLVHGVEMFLDGRNGKVRDAVHILFAGEMVREGDLAAAASISETETTTNDATGAFRVVSLEPLVRMKLTSYRDKDRTHLRDMIEVGLIDATWPARFIPELAARLQALLDDPNG